MTTKAQLYLNEQTAKRSFEEELAAKDREIARLREAVGNALWHALDAALSSRLNERLTALGLVSASEQSTAPSRTSNG